MKIGIITWHTGPNYGTNLQAIALQWYLRKEGHTVYLIDYNEQLTRWNYNKTITEKIKGKIYHFINSYANYKHGKEIVSRDDHLRASICQKCNLTDYVVTVEDFIDCCNTFDLIVVGSDQIWNPTWYAPLYYLDYEGINTGRISYAPSIGLNFIPYDIIPKIRHGLGKFHAISVREESGAKLLKNISPVQPVVTVDPTLLLTSSEWIELFPQKTRYIEQNYVLSIFLTDNYCHWRAAKKFSIDKGLEHVIVPYMAFSYFQKGIICADTDLSKLLNLIQHAEYIITDSFHMTIFSLIFQKQFYVITRFKKKKQSSTNERVRNILRIIDQNQRLQKYNCKRIIESDDIDYKVIMKSLLNEIKASKMFLHNAICKPQTTVNRVIV